MLSALCLGLANLNNGLSNSQFELQATLRETQCTSIPTTAIGTQASI